MIDTQVRSYSACLLAAAMLEVFPDVKPIQWRADSFSFSYDFAVPHVFGSDVLFLLEEKMRQIKKMHFETKSMMRENAVSFLQSKRRDLQASIVNALDQNIVDVVISESALDVAFMPVAEHEDVSFSLLESQSRLVAYTDLGDLILWRISGVAFREKKELKEYIKDYKEAKKHDPVALAEKQRLITFVDESHVWLSAGLGVLASLKTLWRKGIEYLRLEEVKSYPSDNLRKSLEPFEESAAYPCLTSVQPIHQALLLKKSRIAQIQERVIALPEYNQDGLFSTSTFVSDTIHIEVHEGLVEDEVRTFACLSQALYRHLGFESIAILKCPKQSHYTKAFENAVPDAVKIASRRLGPRLEMWIKDQKHRPWLVSFIELDIEMMRPRKRPIFGASFFYSCERILALMLEKNRGRLPQTADIQEFTFSHN